MDVTVLISRTMLLLTILNVSVGSDVLGFYRVLFYFIFFQLCVCVSECVCAVLCMIFIINIYGVGGDEASSPRSTQ